MGIGREFLGQRCVRDGELETVAERLELCLGHLLDLVGGVAGLHAGAEGPALHGLGQDDGRSAGVLDGGAVGGVDLGRVVASAAQPPQVVVGEVGHQGPQTGVRAKEVLADVGAGLHSELLVLAVQGDVHLVDEHSLGIGRQQRVPLPSPDHLDDVPASPSEQPLQLLDDLGVAPDRPVEALEIAVDHEDQVG